MEKDLYKGNEEQQRSVPIITEHDSKEEGESDDRKGTGVGFLVGGNTVSVYDLLGSPGDIVRLVEGRRLGFALSLPDAKLG